MNSRSFNRLRDCAAPPPCGARAPRKVLRDTLKYSIFLMPMGIPLQFCRHGPCPAGNRCNSPQPPPDRWAWSEKLPGQQVQGQLLGRKPLPTSGTGLSGSSKIPSTVIASEAKQSITDCFYQGSLDCHVASLRAMTVLRGALSLFQSLMRLRTASPRSRQPPRQYFELPASHTAVTSHRYPRRVAVDCKQIRRQDAAATQSTGDHP